MPYKNPEDKRKWEREHRVQRNDRRRKRHLDVQDTHSSPKRVPDPVSNHKTKSGWTVLAGVVLAVGIGVFAGLLGARIPGSGD
jgi:hypothetical protein